MIKLPPRLAEKLAASAELEGLVLTAVSQVWPLVDASRLPFFPEYTDHGPTHIAKVLASAEQLVPEQAWDVLTAADSAILILSAVLHDLGLHLSEEGFLQLVSGTYPKETIRNLAERGWDELWLHFISEARRFDGPKLIQLFGDMQPVRIPPSDPRDLTMRDRMLVGEFIRRHHHRLAHEIALFGLPAIAESQLKLMDSISFVSDLAGLVARSHGTALRELFNYLEDYYDLREFRGVHAVYLMSLLRVADFIQQFDASRAPEVFLRVNNISSPVSLLEWRTHTSVIDVRTTHPDPEAVFVHATPTDVASYLRLKHWLAGFQHELDTTWAVLGEVYGRYPSLSRLGLTIRRIRSNIDDDEKFARTVDYVPRLARFETANSELMKLLVKPLYGNDSRIGVRELVQNAVDAVLERREWEYRSNLQNVQGDNEIPDVIVKITRDREKNFWIEIADQGLGMTVDTVINYFLRAGASFRSSHEWKLMFEDDGGHSSVLRTGRFGIGALAAFLLGDEIRVSTRHVAAREEEGIRFRAMIDTSAIHLQRVRRPVGTTIRIKLSADAVEQLIRLRQFQNWDWYCLADPRVERRVGSRVIAQKHVLPSVRADLPEEWHRLEVEGFTDTQWTFSSAPRLTVNGITVLAENMNSVLWQKDHLAINTPSVSVFDPDGNLPLNLQRDEVEGGYYPFDEELLWDVAADILRVILLKAPDQSVFDSDSPEAFVSFSHPGMYSRQSGALHSKRNRIPLLSTDSGISFLDYWHLCSLAEKTLILIPENFPAALFSLLRPSGPYVFFAGGTGESIHNIRSWMRFALGAKDDENRSKRGPLSTTHVGGRRVLLHASHADYLSQPRTMPAPFRARITEEWRRHEWALWKIGNCPVPNLDFEYFAYEMRQGQNTRYRNPVVAEWYEPGSCDRKVHPQVSTADCSVWWVGDRMEVPDKLRRRRSGARRLF